MFEMDRKQFEEWFKTTLSYAIFEDSNVWKVDLYAFNEPTNSYLHSGVQAAFESYQHQQAKVVELQKQLSEYIFVAETLDEMYVKEVQKSDGLQKRMNKAIRLLVEAELYQSEPNIDLAVKALKGEG